jgi:hypothetical protein
MSKVLYLLKKSEIYFISMLFILNGYCAFALRGDLYAEPTHLTLAAVLLVLITDKLVKKLEKK